MLKWKRQRRAGGIHKDEAPQVFRRAGQPSTANRNGSGLGASNASDTIGVRI
jgi:hypothetical protein